MNNKLMSILVVILLMVGASHARASLIVVIDGNGQLAGANNVVVNNVLYNVRFMDGTCVDLFSGCDDSSDFTFQTENEAVSAASALLDQVFVDGSQGAFDTQTALTAGCSVSYYCMAWTPFQGSDDFVLAGWAWNWSGAGDIAIRDGAKRTRDLTNDLDLVYAKWETATVVTAVNEPSIAVIFALSLMGLTARRFKKQS